MPKFVYHVTFYKYLPYIAAEGLIPNRRESIGGQQYVEHKRGKIFLTEKEGLHFWMARAEEWAMHRWDDPSSAGYFPVVLRTDQIEEEDLEEDEQGSRDALRDAWTFEGDIPPEDLTLWNGRRWVGMDDLATIDLSTVVDAEGYLIEPSPLNPLLRR